MMSSLHFCTAFLSFLTRENNFCDVKFAFLYINPFLKRGYSEEITCQPAILGSSPKRVRLILKLYGKYGKGLKCPNIKDNYFF